MRKFPRSATFHRDSVDSLSVDASERFDSVCIDSAKLFSRNELPVWHSTWEPHQSRGGGFAQLVAPQVSLVMESPQTMTKSLDARAPLALERGPDAAYEAYNEAAFRHFLSVERQRAERAGRSLLLVLVALHAESAMDEQKRSEASAEIFSGLHTCVREIDFIGWYRTGRVLGAVLTQGERTPESEACRRIGDRLQAFLRAQVSGPVGQNLTVQVLQVRSN
jgi:hypothetical protein